MPVSFDVVAACMIKLHGFCVLRAIKNSYLYHGTKKSSFIVKSKPVISSEKDVDGDSHL